ncbi:expressed unknown protein [Seminavis robusta]|uniref:CRAL-TRIO domain-containing protein n=1 Tax=Seminavis robusta TaxID=568900 RepID=A0A9N8H7V6_9STRA|nr:expressed unknown protein [Seminavis robusta]|eukprot:Sro140_g065590.1 n/a (325) ;mRNA; f:92203-93177
MENDNRAEVPVPLVVAAQEDGDDDRPAAAAADGPPRNPMGPHGVGRMELSSESREFSQAWNLVNALLVETEPKQTPLKSDFEYVQFAIAEPTDVEAALERISMLQHFRSEHRIQDTVHDGVMAVLEAMTLFPGFLLSLSFTSTDTAGEHYTLAMDSAKLNARLLARPDGHPKAALAKAMYYILQAANPDLEAMRQGLLCFIECNGFDWKKHLTVALFQETHNDIVLFYPTRWYQANHFHTGFFYNMVMAMGRPFLSEQLRQKIRMGCVSPAGRLNRIYLQPNLHTANERFLGRLNDALHRRYANEVSFVLRPPDSSNDDGNGDD